MPVIEVRTNVFEPGVGYRPLRPGEEGCPVCHLTGGFHDHRHVVVDPKYYKEKGWHKKDE